MLLTATASVGTFTACSNDDPAPRVQPNPQEGTTMMSIQFSLQMPKQKRAADDKQNLSNPEFNYAGKWIGNDLIKAVDVYIFKADPSAPGGYSLETSDNLDATKIDFQQPMAGSSDVAYIRPKKGFKVNPGQKKVFVVVNPNAETQALLTGATDLTAFEAKYNGVMTLQKNGAAAPTVYNAADAATAATNFANGDPFTVADHLARVEGAGSAQKDVIVMTGLAGEINVQDNVNETQTLNTSAPVNRAKVTVQRAVARVLVTSDATSYDVKGDDPTTATVETEADGNAVVLATIDNLTYVVAQGESSLYFNQQDSDNPTNYQYKTPNSTYIPTGTADDPAANYGAAQYAMYDYTGLWRKHDNKLGGYDVPTNAAYDASLNNVVGQVQNQDGLHGEFFLPNTHAYHDTDRGQSGYRKGNTAYVLIRGKINPKFVYTGNGNVDQNWTATHPNADVFLGDDGKFYETADLAKDPTTANNPAAAAMKVKKFVGGKVLYFVWVNPDHTSGKEWINSPAIRNNIYHIQISGIANYVYNWNPLIPNPNQPIDPNKPVSPENPRDPNNPNNPDPQPSVPTDPSDPTKPNKPDPNEPPTDLKPNDPLSLKEAWMSVDVTILPWQVHTAKVILGN